MFPYTTIENFESGTLGHFDVETDANGGLDFPHYSELARFPNLSMPYRGAYCARVDMPTVSTDGAWLQETGSWDLTAGTDNINIRLKFWLSHDVAMADGDVFSLIELWSSTSTVEAVAAVQYTDASGWRLGIGETAPTVLVGLTLGEWHDLEIEVDPAGGTGTIDAWLDGTSLTQVASLTQANITSGVIGVVPGAAFTPTGGTVLIDQVIGDVATTSQRIGSGGRRFPTKQHYMEKSGHAFVGHGIVDNVSLLSGAASDNICTIYDTDHADDVNSELKLQLKNIADGETPVDPAGVPLTFTYGCYVQLEGTDPRAIVDIHRAAGYGSDGVIRSVANRQ